jgi:hypothetical protein
MAKLKKTIKKIAVCVTGVWRVGTGVLPWQNEFFHHLSSEVEVHYHYYIKAGDSDKNTILGVLQKYLGDRLKSCVIIENEVHRPQYAVLRNFSEVVHQKCMYEMKNNIEYDLVWFIRTDIIVYPFNYLKNFVNNQNHKPPNSSEFEYESTLGKEVFLSTYIDKNYNSFHPGYDDKVFFTGNIGANTLGLACSRYIRDSDPITLERNKSYNTHSFTFSDIHECMARVFKIFNLIRRNMPELQYDVNKPHRRISEYLVREGDEILTWSTIDMKKFKEKFDL